MAPVSGLWPQVIAPEALYAAFRRAAAGKRKRPEVAAFEWDLESQLARLHEQLADGSWQPGGYREFVLFDRKRRVISVAPFADRVVHHVLMAVVEPVLDARMHPNSYACRPNKGMHAAVAWYQRQARRYAYALKLDLARYFPSIDHAILKAGYRSAIADPMMLVMLDRIVDSGGASAAWLGWLWPDEDLVDTAERRCGLPIGNLTSQVLSNWMLDPIDWALAQRPGVGAMLRYVDDIVVLGDRKADLWAAVEWLDEALARLRLKRHPFKLQLIPTRLRMDLLGYQAGRRKRWLRNNTAYAARRRLHEVADDYREGRLLLTDVRSHVNAWIGHARFAHSAGLRCAILDPLVFQRGSVET